MKPDSSREFSYGRFIVAAVVIGVWVRWLATDPWVVTAITVGVLLLVVVVVSSVPRATVNVRSLLTTPVRPSLEGQPGVGPAGAGSDGRGGGGSLGDMARALLIALGVGAAVVLLGFLLAVADFMAGPGPPNDEARRRERLLLALPVGDVRAAGLTPVDQRSSPGEGASGFAADSPNPVTVRRTYRFAGDALAGCNAAAAELAAAGWQLREFSYPCEAGTSPRRTYASLLYQCEGFSVRADVLGDGPSSGPSEVRVVFETQYPGAAERVSPYDRPPSQQRGSTTPTTEPPGCPAQGDDD